MHFLNWDSAKSLSSSETVVERIKGYTRFKSKKAKVSKYDFIRSEWKATDSSFFKP